MSDLVQSLGMVFDSATTGIGDLATSFLNDAASAFDSGALSGTDTTAPPVDTSVADTQAAIDSANAEAAPPASVDQTQAAIDAGNASAPITEPTGTSAPTPGVLNSAATWFQNLSPGAQAILAKGISGGAGAMLASLAQKHALEAQQRRYDQQRQDKIREHYVAPISGNAFTPKGVIDGARGG